MISELMDTLTLAVLFSFFGYFGLCTAIEIKRAIKMSKKENRKLNRGEQVMRKIMRSL